MQITVKKETKDYCIRNIAPPLGVMVFCLLGSFLVYKGYYSGTPASLANIAPAAGSAVIEEDGNTYYLIDPANIPSWSEED